MLVDLSVSVVYKSFEAHDEWHKELFATQHKFQFGFTSTKVMEDIDGRYLAKIIREMMVEKL